MDGMKSVCEINQTKGLDINARFKASSEAPTMYEPQFWSSQTLKVTDNGTDR